mgnify:FL=1
MANTYTWSYPQLDTAPTEGDLSDVIKTIHWRITAVSDSEKDADNDYMSATMYGTTSVAVEEGADFIAFNSITQDWCKSKVLADIAKTEEEVQASLDAQIVEMASPSIVGKVPSSW